MVELASLDIFNDLYPGRFPAYWELKSWADLVEVAQFSKGAFSEPLAFSVRALRELQRRQGEFDLVHDNQSLGLRPPAPSSSCCPPSSPSTTRSPRTASWRWPTRPSAKKRRQVGRWYSFIKMQAPCRPPDAPHRGGERELHQRHPRRLRRGLRPHAPGPRRRRPGALPAAPRGGARARPAHHHRQLRRRPEGPRLPAGGPGQAAHRAGREPHGHRQAEARRTGRGRPSSGSVSPSAVQFVSGVSDERIVELYAEAELAVVPSLYEGFSLPAVEAMATGICLVATDGGALPEVTGRRRRHRPVVPGRRRRRPRRHPPPRPRRPGLAGPGRCRRPAAGDRALELAPLRPAHRRPVPRGAGHAREPGQAAAASPRAPPPRRRGGWPSRARGPGAADADGPLRDAGRTTRRPPARPRLRLRAPRLRGGATRCARSSPSTTPRAS